MSTYPEGAFILQGGCNCGAVRYLLAFPDRPSRQLILPADKSNGQGDLRLPQSAVCFCNDCRRASGGMVLFGFMAPFHQTRLRLHRKPSEDQKEGEHPHEPGMSFISSEYFPPKEQQPVGSSKAFQNTYLTTYQSSEKAMRGFCSVRLPPLFLFRLSSIADLTLSLASEEMRDSSDVYLHQAITTRSDLRWDGYLHRHYSARGSGEIGRIGSVCEL